MASNGINKVILIGNVGRDPEIRDFANNVKASFPLATSQSYKDRDGQLQTKTEWHNIVLWGDLARTAEKCIQKGQEIYVEGSISTRSYDDAQGMRRYFTEINGRVLRPYLGNRVNQEVAPQEGNMPSEPMPEGEANPFSKPLPQKPTLSESGEATKTGDDDDMPF